MEARRPPHGDADHKPDGRVHAYPKSVSIGDLTCMFAEKATNCAAPPTGSPVGPAGNAIARISAHTTSVEPRGWRCCAISKAAPNSLGKQNENHSKRHF